MQVSRSELILGGQKSGKSRRAELLARDWLAQSPAHHALLIATAQPWDGEMRERIARHQRDRAERVPGLQTLEEPRDLAAALAQRFHQRLMARLPGLASLPELPRAPEVEQLGLL